MTALDRRSVLLAGAATVATASLTVPVAFKAADVRAALGPDPAVLAYQAWRLAHDAWDRAHREADNAEMSWRETVPFPEDQRPGEHYGSYTERSYPVRQAFYDARRPAWLAKLHVEADAATKRKDEAFDALIEPPAMTVTGIKAKIEGLLEDSCYGDAMCPEQTTDILRHVVSDLERLAGRSA